MSDARLTRLPKEIRTAVEPVIREAARSKVRVALVGGVVRDLLRGERPGRDVDLLVEGDAVALARRASRDPRTGPLKAHPRFGTATLEGDHGVRVDLASARRERYTRPGALPEVEPAAIEDDLARRDFTVNAIAWEPAAKRLHDPWGGVADLAARRLRILHPRSFEDDPTRILRAVRYASRLGLAIEPATKRLLRKALAAGALATVSGDRLRREMVRIFEEPAWRETVVLAARLGVLSAIEAAWKISPRVRAALARCQDLSKRSPSARPVRGGEWMAGLLVAASDLEGQARARVAKALALSGGELRTFERWPADRGTREESIARAALAPASERRDLESRLFSPVRLSIRGADLLEAGVPPGPAVGRALAETRRAVEEGTIRPGDELAFAMAVARRFGRGAAEDE